MPKRKPAKPTTRAKRTARRTSPQKAPAKSRGTRGMGSVFFDARRQRWVSKVPAGRVNGRLKYRWVSGATQAECVAKRAAVAPLTDSATLGEWLDRWLPTHELRDQSRDEYEIAIRLRIRPALGAKRLDALTPFDIEEAARGWGKGAGGATIRKTMAVLSAALQAAHRGDLCARNAARPARKPASKKTNIDPFTPAELLRIVRAGADRPEWRTFSACAATGCRIGEAMSLDDSCFDGARLKISRTRTRRHGYGKPKSARGTRTVAVPAAARPVLAAGLTPTNYTTAHARWARLLEHLGLRHRNPHQLRHSVATHALAAGTPLANVARDLGDTVEVIVRTYLHATDDGRDVSGAMDRLFGGA